VNESPSAWPASAPTAASGPTISFAFNLGKIPDQGEDSDPILRDGPDLGLVGVFDGMGGAGGTVYDTPEGRRTGAYMASRIARDVVERRMMDLLEPDWHLNGKTAASDLQRSVQQALRQRLEELRPARSGLRSRLIRALPTTMALVALQRTQPGGSSWAGHIFWAGDSRAYVFEPTAGHQLTTDDLRDPGDALANLRRDSVVSNAMSADTEFHVNYRRVELRAPFLVVCATDGCFGYLRTPMHFEHLLLSRLVEARNSEAWSSSLQAEIAAVTGDDAAMSTLGVGADFKEFQKLFAPRVAELSSEFVEPLDELSDAVARIEQELQAVRSRQLEEMTERWNRYKSGYERYLRPEALVEEDESAASEDLEQAEPIQASDNSDAMETSTDEPALSHGDVDSETPSPEERPEPIDDSAPERNEGPERNERESS
jgi:serine/threonine protein phosphatase PrpC